MKKVIRWNIAVLLILLTAACGDDEPVKPDDDALLFSPGSLPTATIGQPYSVTITVSGQWTPVFEIYVTEGALPAGLHLAYLEPEEFAVISGTPLVEGTASFTIAASCFGTNSPGQTGEKSYTIAVVD